MPSQLNDGRKRKMVNVLSDVLSRLCERNDRLAMSDSAITRFHALEAPQITINYFLRRIAKYSNCSGECFVLALIYIDRLLHENDNFLVNSLNVHRLLITSIMVGAKFYDDHYYNNAYYGKVGGVSCREINLLESEFLFMINFNLYVEIDVYNTYNERLLGQAQPLQSDMQRQENREMESKELHDADTVNQTEETEEPAVNSPRSTIDSSKVEAPSNSSQLRQMPSTFMPRVWRYPTPRCTPPLSNFLKTGKQIQMKSR